jgi:N6-adenosine-specific RNA methylase IME4
MHVTPPLPVGLFDVILADPGWHFATRSERGRGKCPRYRTESVAMICALPVETIAASACRLFLWCPGAQLPAGLAVLEAWGFTFRSQLVWLKEGSPGTGWWCRGAHENVLSGGRGGRICPAPGAQPRSWFAAPKTRRHSRKPETLHAMIEQIWPDTRKVELFARPPHRSGWTVWGMRHDLARHRHPRGRRPRHAHRP